jgi:hypothetical protein
VGEITSLTLAPRDGRVRRRRWKLRDRLHGQVAAQRPFHHRPRCQRPSRAGEATTDDVERRRRVQDSRCAARGKANDGGQVTAPGQHARLGDAAAARRRQLLRIRQPHLCRRVQDLKDADGDDRPQPLVGDAFAAAATTGHNWLTHIVSDEASAQANHGGEED